MNFQLLRIDGYSHSGKAILMSLLDSHPQVFAVPFHDTIHQLAGAQDILWRTELAQTIRPLRKLVAEHTRYYYLEDISRASRVVGHISATEELEIPVRFDFYHFDKNVADRLMVSQPWTSSTVSKLIYAEMMREFARTSGAITAYDRVQYVATMSGGWNPYLGRFLLEYPYSKIISLIRPVESIFAVHYRNVCRSRSNKLEQTIFEELIRGPVLTNIIMQQRTAHTIAEAFPAQVLRIKFNEFFLDVNDVMHRVKNFLGISDSSSLYSCTKLGTEIRVRGRAMLAEEVEPPELALSSNQMLRLQHRISQVYRNLEMRNSYSHKALQRLKRFAKERLFSKCP